MCMLVWSILQRERSRSKLYMLDSEGFVLRDLLYFMQCFVGPCVSFLSFSDLHILITPLVT